MVDASAAAGPLKILLVAEEAAGARALRMLERGGRLPVAVVTDTEAVADGAERLGIPRRELKSVEEPALAGWMRDESVDLMLNVHSILNPHPEVLAAPRLGAFNMHPGPLPAYAGFNAPSWAILEGETSYAVTVHRMVEEMDAGPIVFEARFPIGPEDTGLKVATGCIREGLPLLERLLEAAESGTVPEREQEGTGRFTWFETPYEGVVPWRAGARRVVDLIRAADYAPYPSPWGTFTTTVGGHEVGIVRALRTGETTPEEPGTVGAVDDAGALIAAGDEWVRIERIELAGEPAAPGDGFAPGAVCEPGPPA